MRKAAVILCRCSSKNSKLFGIRCEKIEKKHWEMTWAFPIDEKKAKHEGYDSVTIKGDLDDTEEYPGCPYCGARSWFICHECGGKLSCLDEDYDFSRPVTCAWCGDTDYLEDYDGSGIKSDGNM